MKRHHWLLRNEHNKQFESQINRLLQVNARPQLTCDIEAIESNDKLRLCVRAKNSAKKPHVNDGFFAAMQSKRNALTNRAEEASEKAERTTLPRCCKTPLRYFATRFYCIVKNILLQ